MAIGFSFLSVLLLSLTSAASLIDNRYQLSYYRDGNEVILFCNTTVEPFHDLATFRINKTSPSYVPIVTSQRTHASLTGLLVKSAKLETVIKVILRPDNEGTFYCGNSVNNTWSRGIGPLVANPLKTEFNQKYHKYLTQEVTTANGSNVSLVCMVPLGRLTQFYTVNWFGFSKKESDRFKILVHSYSQNSDGRIFNLSTLILTDIQDSDYKVYTCKAKVRNPIKNVIWEIDSTIKLVKKRDWHWNLSANDKTAFTIFMSLGTGLGFLLIVCLSCCRRKMSSLRKSMRTKAEEGEDTYAHRINYIILCYQRKMSSLRKYMRTRTEEEEGTYAHRINYIILCCQRKMSSLRKSMRTRTEEEEGLLDDTSNKISEKQRYFNLYGREEETSTYKDLQLQKDHCIGIGAFGTVFRGTYKGNVCAAKMLTHHAQFFASDIEGQPIVQQSALESLRKECEYLQALSHKNIVHYIATIIYPNSNLPVLVMELMDCNLKKYLTQQGGLLPDSLQLGLFLNISEGLEFLHSGNIIHRDMCDDNVLIIENGDIPTAKISDFGMSRLISHDQMNSTLTALGHRQAYLPPEAAEYPVNYTYTLDVYALGVLGLQIALAEVQVYKTAMLLDKLPENYFLRKIIVACLHQDKTSRPTSSEVVNMIATVQL